VLVKTSLSISTPAPFATGAVAGWISAEEITEITQPLAPKRKMPSVNPLITSPRTVVDPQ
jgi:hypothetical protein